MYRPAALLLLALAVAGCGGEETSTERCDGLVVTVSGTDDNDELVGTEGADVIAGGRGDDRIEGRGGDDVLCGGEGADVLLGGEGADRLYGGTDGRDDADTESAATHGDTLAGGPGHDLLDLGEDPAWAEGGLPEQLTYADAAGPVTVDLAQGTATGEGSDTIVGVVRELVGSSHDDRLLGSDGDETIYGGRGNDHIDGRDGADRLVATVPSPEAPEVDPDTGTRNTVVGGPGDDFLTSGAGDDELFGGPGADAVEGGAGADRLFGGGGADHLHDELVPVPGQLLDGGAGTDELATLAPRVQDRYLEVGGTLDLAAGLITVPFPSGEVGIEITRVENAWAGPGPWVLIGDDGPNVLWAHDDETPVEIHAGAGDDVLLGSVRSDILDGGEGHDRAEFWSPVPDELISVEEVAREP